MTRASVPRRKKPTLYIEYMTSPSTEFDGYTALVTGGASGIGLATAQLLADRGARVAVLDRVPADAEGLHPLIADVTDDQAIRAAVEQAGRHFDGRLDILVNNAGIGAVRRPSRTTTTTSGAGCST